MDKGRLISNWIWWLPLPYIRGRRGRLDRRWKLDECTGRIV